MPQSDQSQHVQHSIITWFLLGGTCWGVEKWLMIHLLRAYPCFSKTACLFGFFCFYSQHIISALQNPDHNQDTRVHANIYYAVFLSKSVQCWRNRSWQTRDMRSLIQVCGVLYRNNSGGVIVFCRCEWDLKFWQRLKGQVD